MRSARTSLQQNILSNCRGGNESVPERQCPRLDANLEANSLIPPWQGGSFMPLSFFNPEINLK